MSAFYGVSEPSFMAGVLGPGNVTFVLPVCGIDNIHCIQRTEGTFKSHSYYEEFIFRGYQVNSFLLNMVFMSCVYYLF